MKKLLFLFTLLTILFSAKSQTTTITPTIGVSIQSVQAIETNTLTRIWVAMTSTPGIYVTITGGTVTTIPSGTQTVTGTVSITNNTLTVQNGSISITNTPTVAVTGSVSSTPAITPLTSSPSSVTTSGTVTAGAKYLLFETSGDFVGSIDGLRFLGNGFLPLQGGPFGTLPAIPYVITTGTLYIRKFN